MGLGTFKSIGLVGHSLDNSVAVEEANCILYDSTMLYSVFFISTASGALVVGGVRDTYIHPSPEIAFECSME